MTVTAMKLLSYIAFNILLKRLFSGIFLDVKYFLFSH